MALEKPEQITLLNKVARGTRHSPGQMNKLEAKYAAWLEMRKLEGAIEWYAFEAITLKLAFDTRYTPDFVVMLLDGTLQFREVKGYWEEDAKIKIKIAADKFPFIFIAVRCEKGQWSHELFSRGIEPGLVKMEVADA